MIVHKTDQPNTVVDLFDAHGLTRESGAEIDFLFENADPSAVGDQRGPIVERVGEVLRCRDRAVWKAYRRRRCTSFRELHEGARC